MKANIFGALTRLSSSQRKKEATQIHFNNRPDKKPFRVAALDAGTKAASAAHFIGGRSFGLNAKYSAAGVSK